jgi:predicted PurR-regulated permease PerM
MILAVPVAAAAKVLLDEWRARAQADAAAWPDGRARPPP